MARQVKGVRRGRGEGMLKQKPDGAWFGRISLGFDGNGKRVRVFATGKTKKEVQEKIDDAKRKAADGTLAPPSKLTLGAYLDEWLTGTARTTAGASTLASYENYVRLYIKPTIGGKVLAKVTAFDVEQVMAAVAEKGRSARTQQYVRAILGRALKIAVRRDLIPRNPVDKTTSPKVPKVRMTPLNEAQAKTLIAKAKGDRLCALYVAAVMGGFREGELLGLKWPDINFDSGEITITRKLYFLKRPGEPGEFVLGPPKSEKGNRTVTVPAVALDALREHRKRMVAEGHAGSEFVFVTEEGGHLTRHAVLRQWYAVLEAAGLPRVRFHDLRHSWVSLLIALGVDPKTIQELAGHSTIATTYDIYGHLLSGQKKEAATKLGGMFGRAEASDLKRA